MFSVFLWTTVALSQFVWGFEEEKFDLRPQVPYLQLRVRKIAQSMRSAVTEYSDFGLFCVILEFIARNTVEVSRKKRSDDNK